ncbi:ankyrin, partial [Gloeophyllum trabeum ATCC 11539]
MPGPSRTQRAEAKYNVTTDFPHLGLHSAAANGNIGLVKYALSHGQPVNSVLDGVLPLHAACSFGDEIVVKYLIDNGADVNAPRLPRRYSNEKNRANSQLIIGTSGSTPLHFASANGHTNIVITLLQHGAHPDRPDKHGITPEMLARDNGYTETADLLRNWKINKDRDLWERQ